MRASIVSGLSVGLIFCAVTLGIAGAGASAASASGSASASISITPAPTGASSKVGSYADGQTVAVAAGPNSVFAPHSRVVILECADPGGDAAHLPTSLMSCDENTVQGDTTLVKADGSFTEPKYTMFALPSKTLGEQSNWHPICSVSSACVLFVGEDQNDFTKPKAFSRAFFVMGAGPVTPTPSTSTQVVSPAVSLSSASPAVTLPAATLAYTGPPVWIVVLAALGLSMMVVSMGLRRVIGRKSS